MPRKYVRKTNRRSREERNLSVRAVHRDTPDLDKLTELLIRFTLQDAGERRAAQAREHRAMAGVSDPS